MVKEAKTPVTLHVYAVGHAKAIQEINYVVENFLNEGGVFHGAIEVYGQEFSFGGCRQNKSGIFACKPKSCPMHTYRESIYLGDCKKTIKEVQSILDSMKPEWMGPTYNLLRKNCCSFSNAFAQKLGVGEIPNWVHHLADVGAALDYDVKAVAHGLHSIEDSVEGVFHHQTVHDPDDPAHPGHPEHPSNK
ncbi:Lys63-specific deubiquitinase [Aureococcus anophagefferens]|nr:Lys63-specific deubiquitinase [Aureococcus anophagefferens]